MGIRVEGLISKKVIKSWLENLESLYRGDKPLDAVVTNSGPKSMDGVSGSMLNRLMLESALKDMPPVLYICLKYRWIDQLPIVEALERTGIPKSTYYRRCDKAVDFIYYHVNGVAAGVKDLIDTINSK